MSKNPILSFVLLYTSNSIMLYVTACFKTIFPSRSLKNILPSVAVQVVSIVKTYTNQGSDSNQVKPTVLVDAAFEQSLSELIQDIHQPDHNVRRIVSKSSCHTPWVQVFCIN